jgi:hypothetical protein
MRIKFGLTRNVFDEGKTTSIFHQKNEFRFLQFSSVALCAALWL